MSRLLAVLQLAGNATATLAAADFDKGAPQILDSEGFLDGHPDRLARNRGVFEYQRKATSKPARCGRRRSRSGGRHIVRVERGGTP